MCYNHPVPSKNVIKLYIENGYYHIYNRGVEKRIIFQDEQDYKVFLTYLKVYLNPSRKPGNRSVIIKNKTFKTYTRPLNNYHQQLELLAYCLMPNHFHLLVRQNGNRIIESFMRSLLTKYSVYFNKRYDRVGSLFQGPYKAVLVENDNQLLHLSRYIHLNPATTNTTKDSPLYALHKGYSSYADYIEKRHTLWLKTKQVLSFFKTAQKTGLRDVLSYQSFVEDYIHDPKETLGEITID